jgi:2-polyprenyl-3-methyl-5-hydroxy-6-metoxy-1,4-benzoquinol methylase
MNFESLYNDQWHGAIQTGSEDFGDLELAVLFLDRISLLRKEHRILEIGCGIGKLSNFLFDRGFRNIVSIDIAASAVDYGKRRFPHLNLKQMDATSLDFENGYFDVCLSFDLVEHLPDIRAHLREVYRVLDVQGRYLFQTPNILSNSIIETIDGKGFGWRKYHPSLQFPWTLKKKLLEAGFSEVKYVKIPPLSDYKLQRLPHPLRSIYKLMPWKHLPMFLQIGFYCVAHKSRATLRYRLSESVS